MEDIDVARLRMEVIARMDVRAFGDIEDMVRAASTIMDWVLSGAVPPVRESTFDHLVAASKAKAEQAKAA